MDADNLQKSVYLKNDQFKKVLVGHALFLECVFYLVNVLILRYMFKIIVDLVIMEIKG